MQHVYGDKKVTIKDIANATGYSVATIHRALMDKEGVSQEAAANIKQTAQEMGYFANAVAAALKRKQINIAVVLPNHEIYGKYFYSYISQGWQDYFKKHCSGFNINCVEYLFDCNVSNDEEMQLEMLNQVWKERGGDLDGLLTCPVSNSERLSRAIERFSLTGTTVVLIENDLRDSGRLCCITPSEEVAIPSGALAAEVMCKCVHESTGTVLIASGNDNSLAHVLTMKGFVDFIRSNRPGLEIVKCPYTQDLDAFLAHAQQIISQCDNLVAAYAARAQACAPLASAIAATEKGKNAFVIASDLFHETAQLLENGIIDAVISDDPYEKGVLAMESLVNRLIRNAQPELDVFPPPHVVLKSNVRLFKRYL